MRVSSVVVSIFALAMASAIAISANTTTADTALLATPDTGTEVSLEKVATTETLQQVVIEATTTTPETPTRTPAASQAHDSAYPERVAAPAIGLDSLIQPLGVNEKGEMDVPDGDADLVGWYEPGTVPGKIGSAVMDAHVYAAFKHLKELNVGQDVFIATKDGERLHFIVEETVVYPLAQMPLQRIFNAADGKHLNFITCEGEYSRSIDTYTHRRVVYTSLVE